MGLLRHNQIEEGSLSLGMNQAVKECARPEKDAHQLECLSQLFESVYDVPKQWPFEGFRSQSVFSEYNSVTTVQ